MPELIELAEDNQAYFTNKDIICLRLAGVHRRIWEAARGESLLEEVAETGQNLVGAGQVIVTSSQDMAVSRQTQREEAAAARQQAFNEELQNRYTIEIVEVVVALAKHDGRQWDGMGTVPPELVAGALAVAAPGVSAVPGSNEMAAFLAQAANAGSTPPDVFGYVELKGPNAPPTWQGIKVSLRSSADPMQDSYLVTFPNSPGFQNVKLQENDSIRLTLYDADLTEKDPIGTFDLTFSELTEAASVEGLAQINVASRSQNQVLLVKFNVYPAANIIPKMIGQTFR